MPYPLPPAPPRAGQRNVLGALSLVVAAFAAVLKLAVGLVSYFLPSLVYSWHLSLSSVTLFFNLASGFEAVLAAIAIVLGAVALVRRGYAKRAGAAGLGLGTALLLGYLVNLLIQLFFVAGAN
ncbi:putative membrane protein [Psychromicrobium silvestre]|uniref:Putative membrane protein n=1 Tax=Psychromicrobium silvestre TaxID=1645614 RepID=A0A7Y9LQN7_9MICC|nr:hypothetical protein [Psychromicrobium silvestre]NYE93819.1 putative membrane protein [Psychromicrobium silvestre]